MAVALIVAAGSGERLGAGGPKALVPVAGRPMLEWSLDVLLAAPSVSAVVVALPPAVFASGYQLPSDVIGVAGGSARSESVLAACGAAPAGDPVILVHDAARPMASVDLVERSIAALDATGADAVVTALPVTDTIKRVPVGSTEVAESLDRSQLWAVQTPQIFRRSVLERVLTAAAEVEGSLAGATDDAGLIEAAGGSVHVVAGEPDNFKITVPADLRAAELLLSGR